MNKNNINFQVYRTKEGTLCETACGVLVLLSLILAIVLMTEVREAGSALLIHTGIIGFSIVLMLFLSYKPETFNIPDDSPAELFAATVRVVRYSALLLAFMCFGYALMSFLNVPPAVLMSVFGLLFVPLLCWYFSVYMKTKRKKK